MLKNLIVAMSATVALGAAASAQATDITGAGATFPAPVYAKWAEQYRAQTGIGLNYQAIGSGGGIKQIKAKTVEFGASDKPLKIADLNAAGLFQFPTVMGGVVPVINVPGLQPGQVKLTGAVLAAIYLGDIKKWNDPQIVALNKGVNLPGLPITVVHRSDGSGTSFVFTSTTSAFGRALTPLPGEPAAWITEDVVPRPRNIYGVTKTAAEDLCESALDELRQAIEEFPGPAEIFVDIHTTEGTRRIRLGEGYRVRHTPTLRADARIASGSRRGRMGGAALVPRVAENGAVLLSPLFAGRGSG